ncbi:MAG: alpha/beta hydrolase [Phycisphaerales bacterium]
MKFERVCAIAICAALLAGCGASLSPAPLLTRDGLLEPINDETPGVAQRTEEAGRPVVRVFYATNRARAGAYEVGARYLNSRSIEVHLGEAEVAVGKPYDTWEDLEARTAEGGAAPTRVFSVRETAILPSTIASPPPHEHGRTMRDAPRTDPVWTAAESWADAIDSEFEASGTRNVYLYVHGATAEFTTPVNQLASLAYYMGGDGVHICFTWPSGSTAFQYFRAGDRARGSIRALRELLLFLVEETEVDRINILAYSAGGQVATGALRDLRNIYGRFSHDEMPYHSRIGAVVLAGSDEDYFTGWQYYADEIDSVCEQITVYKSGVDSTMLLARIANAGRVTIGSRGAMPSGDEMRDATRSGQSRVHVVDATSAQRRRGVGAWGHSYWKDNPQVVTDVILQWRYGLSPWERGLVHPGSPADAAWWVFPPDYEERIVNEVAPSVGLPE